MKILKMFFRDKQQQEVSVIETWEVRWVSRTGYYDSDLQPEIRVFPSKPEAEIFRDALNDANKLIGNTNRIEVSLERATL